MPIRLDGPKQRFWGPWNRIDAWQRIDRVRERRTTCFFESEESGPDVSQSDRAGLVPAPKP